jgi:hypothetical protein
LLYVGPHGVRTYRAMYLGLVSIFHPFRHGLSSPL